MCGFCTLFDQEALRKDLNSPVHSLDANILRNSCCDVDEEKGPVNIDSTMAAQSAFPNLADSMDSKFSDACGELDINDELPVTRSGSTSPKANAGDMVDQFDVQNKREDTSHSSCAQLNSQNKSFRCTACDKVAWQVNLHPLLKVRVCLDCKNLMESKMQVKVWSILVP